MSPTIIDTELELPVGSLLLLDQEAVVPRHPNITAPTPHPRIPGLLAHLGGRPRTGKGGPYDVVVLGRNSAADLRRLVGPDVICVGYRGLEVARGPRLSVQQGLDREDDGRVSRLQRFGEAVKARHESRLTAWGGSLATWPFALAIDWQVADRPIDCSMLAGQIAVWGAARGFASARAVCGRDILVAEPKTAEVLASLVSELRSPSVLYIRGPRQSAKSTDELLGLLAQAGCVTAATSVQVLWHVRHSAATTVVRGPAGTTRIPKRIDGLAGVAQALESLADVAAT